MDGAMNEPKINVGIVSRRELVFELSGGFRGPSGTEADGVQRVKFHEGGISWNGSDYDELRFVPEDDSAFFELHDVTIGINFHWERKENQRFAGALRIVADNGTGLCVAINEIPVERYLASVISSEMSAGASAALLKAHAVISRSWLLRQLADRGKHTSAQTSQWVRTRVDDVAVEELVRWYDREDHTLFDVCADDHCQRYQGITRQTSPAVADAVEATRGVVLTYDGEICDARFSKCCGGSSELFGNCWEDVPHPYLEPVDDCDAQGRVFCDTHDAAVLQQVLNSYDREDCDFYRWEVKFGGGELAELLRRKSGIDFGTILELRALERGASSRITRLFIRGEKRSVVVGKELEIRRWLSESHLRSSAFDVERGSGDEFILHGRGWGHGVGLCQIGAAVMGAEGYAHDEILKHYFPKAQLTKIYE